MSAILNSTNVPAMREFNVSNALLGDPQALAAAWERDGYWFFRDVLDRPAIARVRATYLRVLRELGVIDPEFTDAAVYNGATLEDYPIRNNATNIHADPLLALQPMKAFVAEPAIHRFFTRVLGDEPFWVPNTEYHAMPPRQDRNRCRFNFLHEDGANNKGLPLRVCWIPLALIDEEIGGLALTEGLHRSGPTDFARPPTGIPSGVIPDHTWRRATYRPGDLLMFDLNSPHSGLANYSDKYFRLSMDIRVMGKSGNIPVIGTIAAVDAKTITIADLDGQMTVFVLNPMTFCRSYNGIPMPLAEIPNRMHVGDPVYVAYDKNVATFIRPQH